MSGIRVELSGPCPAAYEGVALPGGALFGLHRFMPDRSREVAVTMDELGQPLRCSNCGRPARVWEPHQPVRPAVDFHFGR